MARSGIVFVVSAPSGGGKGTILAKVFEKDEGLRHAVSATTRPPRESEVDGKHYHYLSEAEFEQWNVAGRFAESANVHGAHYGTLKSELERILDSGHDVVLELDVQGMRSISHGRGDVVSVFIIPPSMAMLEERLRRRGGLDEDALRLRLKNAEEEMAAAKEYNHIVLNDDLDEAVVAFLAILETERGVTPTSR